MSNTKTTKVIFVKQFNNYEINKEYDIPENIIHPLLLESLERDQYLQILPNQNEDIIQTLSLEDTKTKK
jgi:hypothetical protein